MIPVNATALYVSACRSVLQCDPGQQQSFTEMYTLLPFFRQSLSCLVCGNLSQDPIAPANSTCQHHVCRGCKGQKMQLKPSCSWCKDYSSFEENRQLSLLVDLYRQLCLYISHTPLLQRISSQVGGSPEVMTLLNEMLVTEKEEEEVAAEEQQEEEKEESSRVVEECKPPSPSLPVLDISPPPAEVPPDPPPSVLLNGPESCNGVGLEEPAVPSSPELEVCDPMEEVALHILGTAACMVEREPEPEELDLAAAAATPQLPAQSCVLSFREAGGDCREVEEGEVLLLSVEEVLQTLEPSLDAETTTTHTQPDRTHTHTYLQHTHPNRTHLPHTHPQTDRLHVTAPPPNRPQPTHAQPERTHAVARQPVLSLPPPVRRKRSHSESDRERVQPLPISCILHGPPETLTPPPPLPHQIQAPTHTYSILANGGPPRARSSLNKAARKHSDPGAKRPHSKPRPGPKAAKERARDRLLAGCLLPPGPAKPLYKKPVEKKGCKCGRATQNPSVLTCRGQRCPCYSNRKACLDCICRGCQNSYMANGEKKLEAFAVPEKALEQTRLTLGINLTSIAAAHLRGPSTGAVHGGALINVATTTGAPVGTAFLSPPSPPREPAYEDSLDLGFHC